MKRKTWEFEYATKEVADAAARKIAMHQGRLDYWTKEMKAAEEAVKESVEVREYDLGYHALSNKLSADNLQVVADPERQRRYGKCITKMQEHMSKIEEYKGYEAALRQQNVLIPLTVDDIIFFGLVDLEETEADN